MLQNMTKLACAWSAWLVSGCLYWITPRSDISNESIKYGKSASVHLNVIRSSQASKQFFMNIIQLVYYYKHLNNVKLKSLKSLMLLNLYMTQY